MVRVAIMFIMVVVKIKEECCSLIYLNDEREKKKRYELPKLIINNQMDEKEKEQIE